MSFIQIVVDLAGDFWRDAFGVAEDPKRCVGTDAGGCDLAQFLDHVGAVVKLVLTTDRNDLAARTIPFRDADTIALEQSSGFVGNRVRGFLEIDRTMRFVNEIQSLGP